MTHLDFEKALKGSPPCVAGGAGRKGRVLKASGDYGKIIAAVLALCFFSQAARKTCLQPAKIKGFCEVVTAGADSTLAPRNCSGQGRHTTSLSDVREAAPGRVCGGAAGSI